MSLPRTARRVLTATAALGLVATAPGFVGIASANDNGSGPSSHSSSAAISTLSPALQTAVKTARTAYFAAVEKAKSDFKAALVPIRAKIQTDTAAQLKAAQDARSAYMNAVSTNQPQATLDTLKAAYLAAVQTYRTALQAAITAAQPAIDTARSTALKAIADAGTAYTKAITDAFAAQVPPVAVPAGLLLPPGKGHGGNGHLGLGGGNGLHLGHDGLGLGRHGGGNGHGRGGADDQGQNHQ